MDADTGGGSVSVVTPHLNNHVMMSSQSKQTTNSFPKRIFCQNSSDHYEDHFYDNTFSNSLPTPSVPSSSNDHPSCSSSSAVSTLPHSLAVNGRNNGCAQEEQKSILIPEMNPTSHSTFNVYLRNCRLIEQRNLLLSKLPSTRKHADYGSSQVPMEEDIQQPSTSRQSAGSSTSFHPVQCCLLELVHSTWTRCIHQSSHSFNRNLQRIVIREQLNMAVDHIESNLCICHYHRRFLDSFGSGSSSREEGSRDKRNERGAEKERSIGKSGQDALKRTKSSKKTRRRNGEKKEERRGGKKKRVCWEEETSLEPCSIQCEGCASNGEDICNIGRDLDRRQKEELNKKEVEGVPQVPSASRDKGDVEDSGEGDDEEDDEHALSLLSAASLRKYRKHFEIPTRASATKHSMLDGVIDHFERMSPEAGVSIAHFMHTVNNRPKSQ